METWGAGLKDRMNVDVNEAQISYWLSRSLLIFWLSDQSGAVGIICSEGRGWR